MNLVMVFFGGAYGSLPDAAIWWCLRTGGGGVLTSNSLADYSASSLMPQTGPVQ